ncbi:MAG: polyprenyl synthetase family protein [Armatimonadetes bacterium]|nr:polyprenyl synthetase family protein [Armatimonadota bacterium]MDW8121304.1 polyprenyl synthetase family protein [Armatimonadota bacterium]
MAGFSRMSRHELERQLERDRQRVEGYLQMRLSQEESVPPLLSEAMQYAVLSGGKRIRPFLVLESCRAVGGRETEALPAAAAVELIHSYSLVHDDLPAIDNDEFRRGRPTCHKVFGEAIAILCGDALQALAFEILSTDLIRQGVSTERALDCVRELARAAGPTALVGGQVLDLLGEKREGGERNEAAVRAIHEGKTAALIRACCRMGGIIGGAAPSLLAHLGNYGYWLGLAFQIQDDLLDITGDPEKLGKTARKDMAQKKLTYPSILGLEGARQRAEEACTRALEALRPLGEKGVLLAALAQFVIERQQ